MSERTEAQRKKEARKLIRQAANHRILGIGEAPPNVTFRQASRLSFAYYEVRLDGLNVIFQDDGKRVYYLGEFPPLNQEVK